nr:alpha/beta hydrolase [Arthrobacter sp. CAU 1506]
MDRPAPTVLYFHGGGWAGGDRKDSFDARILPLAATGIAVVSVEYRLTDVASFPAQLLDARSAVRWVREVGPAYGLSVARRGSWESSAVSTLAALLGLASPIDDNGHLLEVPLSPVTQVEATWGRAPLDLAAMLTRSWLEASEIPMERSEAALFLNSQTYEAARNMSGQWSSARRQNTSTDT